MTFSCNGCEKRFPGCHGICETYKKERAEYDARKTVEDKKKAVACGINAQKSAAILRAKRRSGKRGKPSEQ